MLTSWNERACGEGIAPVAGIAGAGGQVVDHPAHRVDTAHARTRVHTMLVLTCTGARTVGVDRAFRPAGHVRVAEIFRDARTCGRPLSIIAYGILAAG